MNLTEAERFKQVEEIQEMILFELNVLETAIDEYADIDLDDVRDEVREQYQQTEGRE